MSSPLKSYNPYKYGRLSVNPNAKLREAVTSVQMAKATWDNPLEDVPCDAKALQETQKLQQAIHDRIEEAHIRRQDREKHSTLIPNVLMEKMEIEAENYALKEKLRELKRLQDLQTEDHQIEIRQKNTQIWNLKGQLKHDIAISHRREISLKHQNKS
tara:strand:+ start:64 stop:534 length:471 start_codon:yes stop_codon:yes gene_type:complete